MIRIKEMLPSGFYILQGESSANSCFIENKREAKLFLRLANRYLTGYVKVHEYLLYAEGWMIQLTLKDRKSILKKYKTARRKKNKEIRLDKKEPWEIISEQVRQMLSQFVKLTNKMENREGSKVKESYRRYYFEKFEEAKHYIKKMREQKVKVLQRNKKYRKIKTHYEISKKEGKGHVFLCSKKLRTKKKQQVTLEKLKCKALFSLDLDYIIVEELTSFTTKSHFLRTSP